MRVVFDTHILVSALVFPGGRGEAALRRIIEDTDQLVLSRPILDELLAVLGRKFARDAEELSHVAVYLTELCAVAGRAEIIVTGDKPLLALKRHGRTRLLTLRDYLDIA